MKLTILLIARRDLELEALSVILTDVGCEIGVCDPIADRTNISDDLSLERYQLTLLDARIENPLGIISSLTASAPSMKIAMMVEHASTDFIRSAFSCGVAGVLDRRVSLSTLICQLELLVLGGCVIPSDFVEKLTKLQLPLLSNTMVAVERLSIREREIVQCIASGMPNKIIARELHLSEPTVKVHVGAVLRKLNLNNRTKVAVWAASFGTALTSDAPMIPSHFREPRAVAARSTSREHRHVPSPREYRKARNGLARADANPPPRYA